MSLTGDFLHAYDPRTGIQSETVDESHCPCCGSRRIDYIDTDYGNAQVFMSYRCSDCTSQFEHHYDFSGIYHNSC